MTEIEVTDSIIKAATNKAQEMGMLNNSITNGDGNLAGFIGEEIVCKFMGGETKNTYDFDIIYNDETYDVKTKRCTSKPKEYYECSVAAFNIKQKCDKYVFVRIQYKDNKFGPAWILGYKNKNEYFKEAVKLKKGQIDPSNNFVVKADCYNLPINKLNPLEKYDG